MTKTLEHPTAVARRTDTGRGWARAWPLPARAAEVYAGGMAAAFVATTAVGLVIVRLLDDGPLGRFDRDVAIWWADQRTPSRESLAHVGSALSDALTLTPAVVLLCLLLPPLLRRWHDAVMVGGALLFEKLVFVTSTYLVGRDRPPVTQLDGAPPTSSFPSGHVGAAVAAYGALAVVVFWHTRRPIWRAGASVVAVLAPLAVALSRMFLGMHHLTDVAAGAALGVVAVLVTRLALEVGTRRLAERDDVPERCRRLDLTAQRSLLNSNPSASSEAMVASS